MVEMPAMNDVHLEEMLIINKLSTAAQNDDIATTEATFRELIEHTIEHSKFEEDMMIEKKFPPYPFHKEEHDKALSEMHAEFDKFLSSKNTQAVRSYIEFNYIPWFLHHVETLDGVTARFLENAEEHLKYWDALK